MGPSSPNRDAEAAGRLGSGELAVLFGMAGRRRLAATAVLMLLGALAELAMVAAAVPFIAGLIGTPAAAGPDWLSRLADTPGRAAALLGGAALLAAALRLLLAWRNGVLVRDVGHDLAARLFANAIRRPYAEHLRINSSVFLAGVEQVNALVYGVLQPALNGIVAGVIALALLGAMLAVDPVAAIGAGAGIGAVYVLVLRFTRARLRRNSRAVADGERRRIRAMQEGLGAIRDIILDRSWARAEDAFAAVDRDTRRRQAELSFIAAAARPVVEAAVLAGVAILAVAWSARSGGLVSSLPALGALLLAGQRLIPLLHQIYVGLAHAAGHRQSILDVVDFLRAPADPAAGVVVAPFPFASAIELRGVSFRYGGGAFALDGVDLLIRRGERVGITGPTGGGKSTLLDLVMGLLAPTAGAILVDGTPLDAGTRGGWHAQVAHVPQHVFLADASLAANIAFGADPGAIDMERVRRAAVQAELAPFIDELPDGYGTEVGERGVRLSGGQRQRIGLARAFYKGASVLVLDEATSALDEQTEAAVLRSLRALPPDTTVITVAHRRTALADCDRVLLVEGGRVRPVEETSEPA